MITDASYTRYAHEAPVLPGAFLFRISNMKLVLICCYQCSVMQRKGTATSHRMAYKETWN